ncbi:MAG TPA: polyprenyl synthetase family protein [Candidatus Saccharimonadales bacterium]|nr:polyprenyl synthetase family protein [Candidatus Saccharimonadales bacterium]
MSATDFTKHLTDYQTQIEADIAKTSANLESYALQHFGEPGRDVIKAYSSVMSRGGKRLRGALVLSGYGLCGGNDPAKAMPIARAMEMIQTYLLINDDIYDQSATRRGGPTAHVMLQSLHAGYKWHGDSARFGESAASCAAFFGCHMAMQEITDSALPNATKVAILRLLNHAITVTTFGQIHDIYNEASHRATEVDVANMHTWKTAYYTFIGPLQAGALAAGAPQKSLEPLYAYGKYMGLAFQAADDLLGTFGNQKKSGKSTQDDIRDGKFTLLVTHVLTHASPEQKREFMRYLGSPTLTEEETAICKKIMQDVGAEDHVRHVAQKASGLAVKALDDVPASWDKNQLTFLRGLASYVVERAV